MEDLTRRPILNGLLALLLVSVAVGLIAGAGAFFGVKASGVGANPDAGQATAEASMFLPEPAQTIETDSPAEVTDTPGDPSSDIGDGITLETGQATVAPMQRVDLKGSYPGGDGAVLQVQRYVDGGWQDFPVSAVVRGQSFSTYVQTSQLGANRFRVYDPSADKGSNSIKVTIS